MKNKIKQTINIRKLLNYYLLNNPSLVVARGEIIKIDDFLDVGLHLTDELELNIGLKKSTRDLVEAVVQNLLVDYGGITHLLDRPGYAPS